MPIEDETRGAGATDRFVGGWSIAAGVVMILVSGPCTFAAVAARSPAMILPLAFLAFGVMGVVQGVRKWRGEAAQPVTAAGVGKATGSALGAILMAIGALITAMAGISMLAGLVAIGSDPDHVLQGLGIAVGFGSGPVLLGLAIFFLGRKLSGRGRR